MGKVFSDGLKDKSKKIGVLKIIYIEDNLSGSDNVCGDGGDNNNNQKFGLFKIIKDIKNKGIKISDDDEAIREIRNHIKNLRNDGVRINDLFAMCNEINNHIQNLKNEGIKTYIDNNQLDDFLDKIFKGIKTKDAGLKDKYEEKDRDKKEDRDEKDENKDGNKDEEEYTALDKTKVNTILKTYNRDKLLVPYRNKTLPPVDGQPVYDGLDKLINKQISIDEFLEIFNKCSEEIDDLYNLRGSNLGPNQKIATTFRNNLVNLVEKLKSISVERPKTSSPLREKSIKKMEENIENMLDYSLKFVGKLEKIKKY